LADRVHVDVEELPAVVDVVAAMRPDSPRVFDEWPNNAYISTRVLEGNPESLTSAPVRVRRRLRLNRQATVSLEGRGVLAYWDHRLDELVVYLSTQGGQVKRLALSRMLGLPEQKVRVIAPDVGGGFGGKNRIMPEDVAVAAIALKVKHPVRWIEDRTEALKKGIHERDQIWDMTAAFDSSGRILGLESEVIADVGSVLIDMFGVLPARLAVTLPFPYDIPWIHTHLRCAITNKAPMGVNRPAGRMPAEAGFSPGGRRRRRSRRRGRGRLDCRADREDPQSQRHARRLIGGLDVRPDVTLARPCTKSASSGSCH